MKRIIILFSIASVLAGCDFLDPLPNGNVTDQNLDEYPSYIRGFVEKAYDLMPTSYITNEYIYLDAVTDDAVITSSSTSMRKYGTGVLSPNANPFEAYWNRDYKAIMYVNTFLEDNLGFTTRYLVDNDNNALLQRYLQGDAYALRAWFEFNLLQKFGGMGTDGQMLGFPILTEPVDVFNTDPSSVKRNTYDECVRQILDDCDSALVYLPVANRDWLGYHSTIDGASRWKRFDCQAVKALKAMVYLYWASPAFNPDGDASRWDNAARYAAEVMDFKLVEDGRYGFDPADNFTWLWPNSMEIIMTSNWGSNSQMEYLFYPEGFRGNGGVGASQNLVDAFPMANGYPITDERSGYDPENPYVGRDPRFYCTINYNGADVVRPSNGEIMYTFDMSEGGKDVAGGVGNVLTNYYIRKYINLLWNKNDDNLDTEPRSIYFFRWSQMCLIFAEAANHVVGPSGELYGFTPMEAIAYLRDRPTVEGLPGIGTDKPDPYLEEVAAKGEEAFDQLVRNERRIEMCFEGQRYYDLRRWAGDAWKEAVNVDVLKPVFKDGGITYETVEKRVFSSPWLPVPYYDAAKCGLVQNQGWESWR
ncbi:MAG: RagB/SusD family nutrient uptake outer membrane protein [Candidatus Cryptobacteroides sp.]